MGNESRDLFFVRDLRSNKDRLAGVRIDFAHRFFPGLCGDVYDHNPNTSGTAEDAATARAIGKSLRSEAIKAKRVSLKTKYSSVAMSVALIAR